MKDIHPDWNQAFVVPVLVFAFVPSAFFTREVQCWFNPNMDTPTNNHWMFLCYFCFCFNFDCKKRNGHCQHLLQFFSIFAIQKAHFLVMSSHAFKGNLYYKSVLYSCWISYISQLFFFFSFQVWLSQLIMLYNFPCSRGEVVVWRGKEESSYDSSLAEVQDIYNLN